MEVWTYFSVFTILSSNYIENTTTTITTTIHHHTFPSGEETLPILIHGSYVTHIKRPRLSPAPEIISDKYESTFAVINFHPLPVVPTKPHRPSRKPSRKPPPPPPAHLVAESLLPVEQEVTTTSTPELMPIPPLPPPIPSLSSQVHDIKEGSDDLSLPPPRPHSASNKTPSLIVKYIRKEDGIGNYYFEFESGDETKRVERGSLKKISGAETKIASKQGFYKFSSPDGLSHRVDYVADERGYRPKIQRFYVNSHDYEFEPEKKEG